MITLSTNEEFMAQAERVGGSAFPSTCEMPEGGTFTDGGMTLRDWFAGQAIYTLSQKTNGYDPEWLAKAAYTLADAMIEARK